MAGLPAFLPCICFPTSYFLPAMPEGRSSAQASLTPHPLTQRTRSSRYDLQESRGRKAPGKAFEARVSCLVQLRRPSDRLGPRTFVRFDGLLDQIRE
jgi:hypothetical protein